MTRVSPVIGPCEQLVALQEWLALAFRVAALPAVDSRLDDDTADGGAVELRLPTEGLLVTVEARTVESQTLAGLRTQDRPHFVLYAEYQTGGTYWDPPDWEVEELLAVSCDNVVVMATRIVLRLVANRLSGGLAAEVEARAYQSEAAQEQVWP